MIDLAQPQTGLDTHPLEGEIEKTISDLTEFRGLLMVRLGIIDDRIIQFTDILKQIKPKTVEKASLATPETKAPTTAQRLDVWLRENGASDGWVSCRHEDFRERFSCSLPTIGYAFRSLEAKGLRAFAGKPKHYTFNADLPDPFIVIRGKTGVSRKTLNELRAVELSSYLQKLGADKVWISLTFTSISSELKWPINSVRPVIDYLVKHHGLEFYVGRLKTPSRFTFSKFEKSEIPPEPAPKPAIKRIAVKSLTVPPVIATPKPKPEASSKANVEVEDALLEKLHEFGAKIGTTSFSIPVKNLVLHVGYTSTQIIAAMDALAANGEITITRFNKPAQEYFLKVSEAE